MPFMVMDEYMYSFNPLFLISFIASYQLAAGWLFDIMILYYPVVDGVTMKERKNRKKEAGEVKSEIDQGTSRIP